MTPARWVAVAAVVTAVATVAGSATAVGSPPRPTLIHQSYDERPVSTHVDGLGPGCPDFIGTLTERRHLVVSGYERGDTARVSTEVTATVTLDPDDPAGVSYQGRYRSLQVGTFAHHGHLDRKVATFTLGRVRGSDGSEFATVEEARTWHGADGRVHRRDEFHCESGPSAP